MLATKKEKQQVLRHKWRWFNSVGKPRAVCTNCGAQRTREKGRLGGMPDVYYTPDGERHVYYPPPCEPKQLNGER
jgi:hypothetical protein